MDMENQRVILKLVEEYGSENLAVVLGAGDLEGIEITSETLISGDPSYSGPLAEVQLGLPVYHILESTIKEIIPPEVYNKQVGVMEMVLDVENIEQTMKKMRTVNSP